MNKRAILAPRYNLRVEDFGPSHRLRLTCLACGCAHDTHTVVSPRQAQASSRAWAVSCSMAAVRAASSAASAWVCGE